MITTGRQLQRMSCSMALSALLTARAVAADATTTVVRFADVGDTQQIVVSIGPFEVAGAAQSGFAWSARLPHGVMLHRVSVELVDAVGLPYDSAPDWAATLFASSTAAGVHLVQLSSLMRALELPRPLGLRLDAEDSLAVRGHVRATGTSAPLHVRITLDYEPVDGPLSRVPVLPLLLRVAVPGDSAVDPGAGGSSRAWQAPVDGRIMVLVGVPLDAAGQLTLEDVESATILWHEILQPVTGEGFGRAGNVVRVGAAVQAGRVYRITLHCADGEAAAAMADRPVHALLAPSRTAMAVAVRD
jgi:hypothetical protein